MKTVKPFSIILGVLLTVCIVIVPGRAAAERPEKRPPNIVLFMADDVGREVLGCYGGTSYRTPRIDALAATGTRFTHCYSMPVCHPSRLTIMTGRYPLRNPAGWGSWPEGVGSFANLLKDAGYATAVAGKWQLALLKKKPNQAKLLGFDQSALFGWHEGPRFHNPLIYRNGAVWEEKRRADVYGPRVYTDFLIDFIQRNKDRPFFAYYPMALCHEISDDFSPVPPPGPDGKYRSFAEMVADMDRMVGRLVAALDRLGLRQNTVVLFTTDNGSPGKYLTHVEQRGKRTIRHHKPVVSMMRGVEIRGGKGRMTDDGTRVPLLANWPGTTPGPRACEDLIDFSDFLPTLLELAGAKLPPKSNPGTVPIFPQGKWDCPLSEPANLPIDGRSFAAQLKGKPGNPRPWVFCEHRGRRWARTKRWKLYDNGRLFDVQSDPAERRQVAADGQSPEAGAARARLQAALDSLKAR